MLSKEPSASPMPESVDSDGRHIILNWRFKDDQDRIIAVFYEGPKTYYLIAVLIILFSLAVIFFLTKARMTHIVTETLSDDEKKVVEQVRKGVKKQKLIAKNLEFSKSKMSKVLRKLEEKGLIEKKPFLKTNIIKLKKIN